MQTRHALNSQWRRETREEETDGQRQREREKSSRLSETAKEREHDRALKEMEIEKNRREARWRMKMKQTETDKTRMLKGFQSGGCLGSSLESYAKAISIEPLLGECGRTAAAVSNVVSV